MPSKEFCSMKMNEMKILICSFCPALRVIAKVLGLSENIAVRIF